MVITLLYRLHNTKLENIGPFSVWQNMQLILKHNFLRTYRDVFYLPALCACCDSRVITFTANWKGLIHIIPGLVWEWVETLCQLHGEAGIPCRCYDDRSGPDEPQGMLFYCQIISRIKYSDVEFACNTEFALILFFCSYSLLYVLYSHITCYS